MRPPSGSGADFATYENAKTAVLILREAQGAEPPSAARWVAGALELRFGGPHGAVRTRIVPVHQRFRALWRRSVPLVMFAGVDDLASGLAITRDSVIAIPIEGSGLDGS